MSFVMTETPANADFSAGHTYPNTGDSGTLWWGVLQAAIQESGDREQALKLAAPGAVSTKVPISISSFVTNETPGFVCYTQTTSPPFTVQALVTGDPIAWFPLPHLGPGLKIVSLTMSWIGDAGLVTAHSALPATMPNISLRRSRNNSVVSVANVSDTSATFGAYNLAHDVVLTANHTVLNDYSYYLVITGEAGANSVAAGSALLDLFMTVAPP